MSKLFLLVSIKLAGVATLALLVPVESGSSTARNVRPAARAQKPNVPKKPEFVAGQYVIQLKEPRTRHEVGALEKKLKARIIDEIRPDMILVERDSHESPEAALKSLRKISLVTAVDPNFIYRAIKTPNDPDYGRLWGLKNTGTLDSEGTRGVLGVDIGAERAWDLTTGSKDVVVAVIDTGVDFNIPDLAANAWTNLAEKNGQPGVDDDQNGYVDDIHGYDFDSNDGDSTDFNGHGSHCAGTIGARGDDGNGVVGVNWNVSIMAVQFLDANGSGTLANAIKALDYARKNGAKILSNSWGGGGASETLKKAIEDTRDAGQLFIAAAGNDGTDSDRFPAYPASFPVDNIVSVAAIDNRGQLAYFSNYGAKTVHVAAPGVNVLSTTPTGLSFYSGTSMATPHVSGVAALLLSTDSNQTYGALKTRLLSFARPLKALDGKVKTGGIIDAYYSLAQEQPPADPNDPTNWSGKDSYSLSSPHPYGNDFSETYTVKVPGARRIAVRFQKFDTEAIYDKIQFFNSAGESLGAMSGKGDGRVSPAADGDTLVLKFTSDPSIPGYGFDVDQVFYEQ